MPLIELVGPSGCGKSTLARYLLRQRTHGSNWVSVAEEAARNPLDHASYAASELDNELLNRKIAWVTDFIRESCPDSGYARYRLLYFLHNALISDQVMSARYAGINMLTDDGLCHLFGFELSEACAAHRQAVARRLDSRSFIVVRAQPGRLLANIRRRAAQGAGLNAFAGRSEDDILEFASRANERAAAFTAMLHRFGRPVLVVDADDDAWIGNSEIRAFVSSTFGSDMRGGSLDRQAGR